MTFSGHLTKIRFKSEAISSSLNSAPRAQLHLCFNLNQCLRIRLVTSCVLRFPRRWSACCLWGSKFIIFKCIDGSDQQVGKHTSTHQLWKLGYPSTHMSQAWPALSIHCCRYRGVLPGASAEAHTTGSLARVGCCFVYTRSPLLSCSSWLQ